mgnify:CR=1 FL=1
MTNILKIIATLAYAFFSISNLNAQNVREINVDSRNCVHLVTFNDKCTPVSIKGKLFNPQKPTDAVVVIMHGSQGVDERHFNYAKHLN